MGVSIDPSTGETVLTDPAGRLAEIRLTADEAEAVGVSPPRKLELLDRSGEEAPEFEAPVASPLLGNAPPQIIVNGPPKSPEELGVIGSWTNSGPAKPPPAPPGKAPPPKITATQTLVAAEQAKKAKASGGPVVRHPEREQKTTATVQTQNPIDPKETEALDVANDLLVSETLRAGEEEKSARLQMAEAYRTKADEAKERIRQIDADQLRRQEVLRPVLESLMTQADEIRNFRVNPNEYWDSKSTGDQVIGQLAIAFSGIGSGHPNQVQAAVNAKIDQSVRAQEARLGAMREGREASESVYLKIASQFEDPDAARMAYRSLLQEVAAAEMQSLGAEIGSKEAVTTARLHAGELLKAAQQSRVDAMKAEAGTRSQQTKTIPAHTTGGGSGKPNYVKTLIENMKLAKELFPNDSEAASAWAQQTTNMAVAGKTFGDEGGSGGTGIESDKILKARAYMASKGVKDKKAQDDILRSQGMLSGGDDVSNPLFVAPGYTARNESEAVKLRENLAKLDGAEAALADLEKQVKAHPVHSRLGAMQQKELDIGDVAAAVVTGGATLPLAASKATKIPVSKTGASIEASRNIAVGALGAASGTGVVNPGEYPRLAQNLGSPEGIAAARKKIAQDKAAMLAGQIPGQPVPVPEAGPPVPGAKKR